MIQRYGFLDDIRQQHLSNPDAHKAFLGPFTVEAAEGIGGGCRPLHGEEGVHTAAFDRAGRLDNLSRYMTHLIFDHVHSLNLNSNFYYEHEQWPGLFPYLSERGHHTKVFENLPDIVGEAFKAPRHNHLDRMSWSCTRMECRGINHLSKFVL